MSNSDDVSEDDRLKLPAIDSSFEDEIKRRVESIASGEAKLELWEVVRSRLFRDE